MSIFEIIGEDQDPGDLGSVKVRPPEAEGGSVGEVATRAVVAFVILAIVGTAAVRMARGVDGTLLPLGALVVYLLLCTVFSPEPDGDNLGMLGGAVDNPVRWSDDVNRGLLGLAVLAAPGRWMVAALIEGVQLARGRRIIVQREVVFPARGARRRTGRAAQGTDAPG